MCEHVLTGMCVRSMHIWGSGAQCCFSEGQVYVFSLVVDSESFACSAHITP